MKIISIVGARPNFMKIAPFCRVLAGHPEVEHVLAHTGQHYDARMSDSFFVDLGILKDSGHAVAGDGIHTKKGKTTTYEHLQFP